MSTTTLSSVQPPKRVLAAGLFGAFIVPKVEPVGDTARAQDNDEFLDDFISGTHSHPCGEEPPAKR